MSDLFLVTSGPAVANAVLTVLVVFTGTRSRRAGLALAVLIPAAFVTVVLASHSFAPGHSPGALLLIAILITLVTWGPGATLAVIASYSRGRLGTALRILAPAVSTIFGAMFILTVLSVVCSVLGDCP